MKIGACIMVHNMAPLIGACVKCLSWTDGIYVYDDHSTDGSGEIAKKNSSVPIVIDTSTDKDVAFVKSELEVRNHIVNNAFKKLGCDVLVMVDADELMSEKLKPAILKSFSNKLVDSLSFSTWHLYTNKTYLHFWVTKINGKTMIDPHIRVIRKGKHFTPLFKDGGHPIILPTENTRCYHQPFHFHLKYYRLSTLPNYSLYFLPERIRGKDARPYLKNLPFPLPKDVSIALSSIKWNEMPFYKSTPHYGINRVKFEDPKQALTHPKDIV